jgi:hypothetical protein
MVNFWFLIDFLWYLLDINCFIINKIESHTILSKMSAPKINQKVKRSKNRAGQAIVMDI